MTTDERIRRAYRSLSEQASLHIDPASGLVAVRGHRRRRSRPVLALTAIAAAVLVVAAGLTALSLEHGIDLAGHEIGLQCHEAAHALGVLRHHGSDSRHPIGAKSREGLDIGLYARPA
jgi:hypothetical protein